MYCFNVPLQRPTERTINCTRLPERGRNCDACRRTGKAPRCDARVSFATRRPRTNRTDDTMNELLLLRQRNGGNVCRGIWRQRANAKNSPSLMAEFTRRERGCAYHLCFRRGYRPKPVLAVFWPRVRTDRRVSAGSVLQHGPASVWPVNGTAVRA